MNRRTFTRCAIALTLTFGIACGSDSTAPVVVASIAGTWKLTSVDAKPLPYILSASDPKLEVTAKQYVITSSGSFTMTLTVRSTELDGTVTTSTSTDTGSSTLANNTATFTYASNGSTASSAVTPTTMTFGGSAVQEFTRQ